MEEPASITYAEYFNISPEEFKERYNAAFGIALGKPDGGENIYRQALTLTIKGIIADEQNIRGETLRTP